MKRESGSLDWRRVRRHCCFVSSLEMLLEIKWSAGLQYCNRRKRLSTHNGGGLKTLRTARKAEIRQLDVGGLKSGCLLISLIGQ